jgi:UDP-N-acetylglucosamine--N-acetylmuramyl-(pentapeptide) pyrophosphoryl-undecaprenol N-acetylglucosamine transferase
MNKKKFICFVAGRSGGHIIPAMTYAQQELHQNPDYSLLFFSTHTQLDKSLVNLYPFIMHYCALTLDNIPHTILRYPKFLLHLVIAFIRSLYYLCYTRPIYVMSMGGYVSIPVCLAARVLRIPVYLFELNAIPGRATNFLARFAQKIHVCFPQALHFFPTQKVVISPYPLRFTPADKIDKVAACLQLGLNPAQKVILILGGSQGSQFINHVFTEFTQAHPEIVQQLQVIHQVGSLASEQIIAIYQQHIISARVFDYKSDLQIYYSAADIVIGRAGAGTLFELAFFEKKSVIIPLETTATDHQLTNAQAMAEEHPNLFTVIRQPEIEKHKTNFYNQLISLLT